MKRIAWIFVYTLIVSTTACNQSASKKVDQEKAAEKSEKTTSETTMSFDKSEHDFGIIKEGETVQTKFTFTNTGQTDLIIVDAKGSCGCTVPSYPKNTPIAPGTTGEIMVSFDSSNKPNMQQKTVTISANTASGRETLRIMATVTPDPVLQKQRDDAAKARQNNNQ